jgi:hypothetical protein
VTDQHTRVSVTAADFIQQGLIDLAMFSCDQVRLVLDCRVHGTSRLATPVLAQLQGPALLCFNDAQFTETDFQSIQRIGDSLKKEDSKGTKTGRFGQSVPPTSRAPVTLCSIAF